MDTETEYMMVGESWNVFKKRVLVEKHISGIMCENQLCPLCRPSCALCWHICFGGTLRSHLSFFDALLCPGYNT